jgi:type I restriction enzyme S subunit
MKFEKLGNIADIIAGQSPPSSTYNSEGKGIPFFQGKADYGEKFPSVRYWCTEPTKISLPDDILISMRAPVGPVNINIVESCIGRGLSAIRVKKNVSRDFIFFWLKQNQHIIAAKETGSTFKAITQKILNEIVVPFPSYPDQIHIANILSKAENLIAQRKESIRLLDEFLKSTFLEMFGDPVRNEKGWEMVILGEVCKKIGSGSTPKGGKESYHKEGISLIRSLNVHNDEFVYKDLAFIDEKQAHELRNVIIEENDVLLNITGASVARCCIVPKEIIPARVNQHVSILRPDNEILNSFFLSRMITSKTYQLKLVKDAKSKGATREAITKEELEQMKVIAPPIKLQTQFAQIVEKTEALKSQYQQSLQELENLYGSLSQRAFKGELALVSKRASEQIIVNS